MGGRLSQPNTQKHIDSQQSPQLRYSCISMQGWERQMENFSLSKLKIDSNNKNGNSLFAIFDGFRGFEVSLFLKESFLSVLVNCQQYIQENYEEALKYTFKKIDELILSQKGQKRLKQIRVENNGEYVLQNEVISENTGSTASIVLLTKKKIYIAHIGDSKIYLIKDNKNIFLSQSHKPETFEQKIRIEKAGGQIVQGRINGNCNVSRCFGLNAFKKNSNLAWDQQMITCCPSIKTIDRGISDQIIFMGCEGFWEIYDKKQIEVLSKIKLLLREKKDNLNQCLTNVLDSTIALENESQNNLGFKNFTAILVKFNEV